MTPIEKITGHIFRKSLVLNYTKNNNSQMQNQFPTTIELNKWNDLKCKQTIQKKKIRNCSFVI